MIMIDADFWKDVSAEEFSVILRTGYLTPRLKAKVYGENAPAGKAQVMINRNDLDWMLWDMWQAHPEWFKKVPPKPQRERGA